MRYGASGAICGKVIVIQRVHSTYMWYTPCSSSTAAKWISRYADHSCRRSISRGAATVNVAGWSGGEAKKMTINSQSLIIRNVAIVPRLEALFGRAESSCGLIIRLCPALPSPCLDTRVGGLHRLKHCWQLLTYIKGSGQQSGHWPNLSFVVHGAAKKVNATALNRVEAACLACV